MHENLCVCSLIAPLTLATRITLFMHRKEVHKTTNSGRLAHLALTNSALFVRHEAQYGATTPEIAPESLRPEGFRSVVLFPCDGARPLAEARGDSESSLPLNIIVPDGTWRQAQKSLKREPALRDLPAYVIPQGDPTRYFLRRETKEGGLATFEAIARALGVLEGEAVQRHLEEIFHTVVRRTLQTRGKNPGTILA
jgi:DTW domain-containing protein YfiP